MMALVDIILVQQTPVPGASIFFVAGMADTDAACNLFFILKTLL